MKKWMGWILALCMFFAACAALADGGYGYGFIDRSGNVVIEPQFDWASNFSEDYACVFRGTLSKYDQPEDGKYGFIDRSGNLVINFLYDKATRFSGGVAAVKKNGKFGLIDKSGETVVDFKYDNIEISYDNFMAFTGIVNEYGFTELGTYTILKPDGTEIFSLSDISKLYCFGSYYQAKRDDRYALFGLDGTQLTDFKWESFTATSDDILGFELNNLYGYIDIHGNEVIPAQFDKISAFEGDHAIVKKDGKYSLIDRSGNIIFDYSADWVNTSLCDGYTHGFDGVLDDYGRPSDGYYYLIGPDGKRISESYQNAYSIHTKYKLWSAQKDSKWYVLNMQGDVVLGPLDCDTLDHCAEQYILKKDKKESLFASDGTQITDYIYDDISITYDPLICVRVKQTIPDFRQTSWGMSESDVRALEGNSPDYTGTLSGNGAKYIGYDTELMGNDVIVAFYFGPDGLYSTRYIWEEEHSNENLFISDYNSVKEQLTAKYGDPLIDKENWDTTSHEKYYADNKGDALSYGFLTYATFYLTDRSFISMTMSADNYDISFFIDYESRDIDAPKADYSNVL